MPRIQTKGQMIANMMNFALRGNTVERSYKLARWLTPKTDEEETEKDRQEVFDLVTDRELKERQGAFVAMLEAWVKDGLFEEIAPVQREDRTGDEAVGATGDEAAAVKRKDRTGDEAVGATGDEAAAVKRKDRTGDEAEYPTDDEAAPPRKEKVARSEDDSFSYKEEDDCS
jgi:hypothetical protein